MRIFESCLPSRVSLALHAVTHSAVGEVAEVDEVLITRAARGARPSPHSTSITYLPTYILCRYQIGLEVNQSTWSPRHVRVERPSKAACGSTRFGGAFTHTYPISCYKWRLVFLIGGYLSPNHKILLQGQKTGAGHPSAPTSATNKASGFRFSVMLIGQPADDG